MNIEKICEFGRMVVEIESKMINNLLTRIDHNFAQACLYLHNCTGRIAVMGIGKSGHVAKKIAATFASTGSPAFFIHPGEAKHGDIGMLTPNDLVLMLSNSGESDEIIAILPYIKQMNIPLISLTGRPQSTLAKIATINIDVSVEREACPLGLAPTSSTTAALVMGDALAMVVLKKRGFTKKDFALTHPGGNLGRRLLLRVNEIMHDGHAIPKVLYTATLKEALVEMTHKKLGMTTIVNEAGELVGIFTDGDVRRAFDTHADVNTTQMHVVMSSNPKTIPYSMLVVDALQIMETYKITSLIILNDERQPDGIVHIHV